jgi:FtsP/CotA-like multicopper oxidase with cupredoxin domain
MSTRNIYLKIEQILGYSPVAPQDEMGHFHRDCARNPGHEDGRVPDGEVALRRVDALVYREYLDAGFTMPNMAPLIANDVTEPMADRRVPGAILYTKPGERLRIHVLNADDMPHSFHLHGLKYGVAGDGSWPFGVTGRMSGRSDEICPGDTWVYEFEATEETIGCWPFHDHYKMIGDNVNRGLFGGIVVRDPKWHKADYEVPVFLHRLSGPRTAAAFDSGTLNPGGTYSFTFPTLGPVDYLCRLHPMSGQVVVSTGGPASAAVTIRDTPGSPRFDPAIATVGPGGTVTWTHAGTMPHTVTESSSGSLESMCLNGRTFAGNTPTIVGDSGKRIRWFVFNLDLGAGWHNFHAHGMRWRWAEQNVDTRSLGPAESFFAETVVPDVVLLTEPEDRRRPHKKEKREKHVKVCGDFLFHCHVEMHMMQGMAGLVRAVQSIEVEDEKELDFALNHNCQLFDCATIDSTRCMSAGQGQWASLPDMPLFVVHAALMHTGRVLMWSGTAEVGYPEQSFVWNPATDARTTQTYDEDLFCAGQTFLADGRLLIAGGAPNGTVKSTHIFDPSTETWTHLPPASDMSVARWYPTLVPLSDGKVIAASGMSGIGPIELFDPATNVWTVLSGAGRNLSELYSSLHQIPSGEIFYSRAGWQVAFDVTTAYLRRTAPAAAVWTTLGAQAFPDRQEGTAVIQIDATASPATVTVMVIGGGVGGTHNAQSVEAIDLTQLSPPPAWTRLADMNFRRTNVNGVLLPDGTVLAIGGQRAGKWAADPQPVLQPEIYDPQTNRWTLMAPMAHPRQYHSIAILLPDGRVLSAGGIDPTQGAAPARDQRYIEVFSPPYLMRGPRPHITGTPATVSYANSFDVQCPNAANVTSVALIRPCAMTHHTDAGQRYIKLPISGHTASRVSVTAPTTSTIAPPGYYMLFIVNSNGVPSEAAWIQITP